MVRILILIARTNSGGLQLVSSNILFEYPTCFREVRSPQEKSAAGSPQKKSVVRGPQSAEEVHSQKSAEEIDATIRGRSQQFQSL